MASSANDVTKHGDEEEEKEILYEPPKGELQLTVRSVVAGCLLGGVVSAMNIYFGLKTGWAIGGSLIAAILGFAIFKVLGPFLKTPYTRLEANITQTAGSGAGTMTSAAGLLSAIPAMGMLYAEETPGVPYLGYFELTFWGLSVAFLGIFFAIPLRKQMVVQEKLRFPTGTATAHTLMAMFAEGGDAMQKAKTLLFCSLGAGLFTLLSYFVPEAQMVPLAEWIPITLIVWLSAISFKLYVSPLMYGAGILIGFRVAASLALGAIVSWRFLGPWVDAAGWVEGPFMSYGSGARGWILWPGVAIMVADALTSLALSWPTIARSLKFRRGAKSEDAADNDIDKSQQISFKVWAIGMSCASAATILMAWMVFDIAPWMSVIAIALSSVLAMIATRSTGETDINPIGGMGKVTQLVFGGLAPGSIVTNLMSAAISSAGASQSGDMMQDLKTGHMLGAAPKKQLIAQIAGVVFGILFAVPIYMLFDSAYDIGQSDQMPAPAAHSWKAMAVLLVEGFDALPTNAEYAIAGGFAFGVIIPVLRKFAPKSVKDLVPSGLAFGIAFIVPAFYSISMFIGAVMFKIFSKSNPTLAKNLGFAIASGLIAGEGLMGIVNAVLTLLQVPTLTGGGGGH